MSKEQRKLRSEQTKSTSALDRSRGLYERWLIDALSRKSFWGGERRLLAERPRLASEPLAVRRAYAIDLVLREMPIRIADGELLAGNMLLASIGLGIAFPDYLTEEEKRRGMAAGGLPGHCVPDYEKLLRVGLRGLREEIHVALSDATDGEARAFLRAMLVCCDAVAAFARRYGSLAESLAADCDEARAAELHEIAAACRQAPEGPARSFLEAVQSCWLYHAALSNSGSFDSCGRADQFLDPFLEADLAAGRITLEHAQEIIDCFVLKFNERTQFNFAEHFKDKPGERDAWRVWEEADVNHWLQNVVLGGVTRSGDDASNAVTFLVLDAIERLPVTQPAVAVRLHRSTPAALFEKCARVLRQGGGAPILYNDDVIVPGLVAAGVPLEDARDYTNDGCWETLIPAKTYFGWYGVNLLECTERTFGLKETGLKESRGAAGPAAFSRYEDLFSRFVAEMDHAVQERVAGFRMPCRSPGSTPDLLLSLLTHGCIHAGADLNQGGTLYAFRHLVAQGFATAVDSLAAAKKLVFEEKRSDVAALLRMLRADYCGDEAFRQLALTRAPKYGCDDKEADAAAVAVAEAFCAAAASHTAHLHWAVTPSGIGTFEHFVRLGAMTAATPDGRRSGEPIGTNASPALGMDRNGPTAALKSYAKLPLRQMATGAPLDLTLDANALEGQRGVRAVAALVRAFVELGGSIMTLSAVSAAALRDAQVHPDRYRHIRVRMGGFQAYFTALNREHQDAIIARTEHRL